MKRFQTSGFGLALAASFAAPATAAPAPSTKLVQCGSQSCVVVSGRRDDEQSAISINNNVVKVEGGRKWRVHVPVEMVRAWSAPYARTIAVSVEGVTQDTLLPIGLLGHSDNLAMLIVRVK